MDVIDWLPRKVGWPVRSVCSRKTCTNSALTPTRTTNVDRFAAAGRLRGGVEAPAVRAGGDTRLRAVGSKSAKILKSPADWNRNTYPIFVHSHNDYEREVPVFEALSYGALTIESDVWLNFKDKRLYVGHDPWSLTPERTFHALTIEPLLKAIGQANSANSFYVHTNTSDLFAHLQKEQGEPHWKGFFSLGVGNSQPVQLLVNIKNSPEAAWERVVQELEPLRRRGWLTRYEDGKVIPGPVTVVGTGSTPPEKLAPLRKRDVFLDCHLDGLHKPGPKVHGHGHRYKWNKELCPIASADFADVVPGYKGLQAPNKTVVEKLHSMIDYAYKLGIKNRFYDTPEWPHYAFNRVNKLLLELGSDWINADDLREISRLKMSNDTHST